MTFHPLPRQECRGSLNAHFAPRNAHNAYNAHNAHNAHNALVGRRKAHFTFIFLRPDPISADPAKNHYLVDRALERAFQQGRGYITSLPVAEGRPPFLIVCDVGHSIDLYAEFSGIGGHYERFPDPKNHRILLTDLRQEKHRATLRSIWTDPYSLDPSKKDAEVTRDIANRLAKLAKSLEAGGHDAQVIGGFLRRCLLDWAF